jgi:hypothetical protein
MTMAANRSVPRFLPTLTEVVYPVGHAPVVEQPLPLMIDPQSILERVRTDVDQVLQIHLESAVAKALLDQVPVIAARIREDIEPLVRQAVADAVAAELEAPNQP